jgi:hypothetical protein
MNYQAEGNGVKVAHNQLLKNHFLCARAAAFPLFASSVSL